MQISFEKNVFDNSTRISSSFQLTSSLVCGQQCTWTAVSLRQTPTFAQYVGTALNTQRFQLKEPHNFFKHHPIQSLRISLHFQLLVSWMTIAA